MNAKDLKAKLRALATDQSGVAAAELRAQATAMVQGKYSACFDIAKATGNEKQFVSVCDEVKAEMKGRGELIDRDFSNATSAIKRHWKAIREVCELHDGKHTVHVKQKGKKELKSVTLTADLRDVESFAQLRQCAEVLTSNGGLSVTLAGKLAALQDNIRKGDEKTANAALDAALAYFLTGTKPRKQPAKTQAAKAKGATRKSRIPAGVELKAARPAKAEQKQKAA